MIDVKQLNLRYVTDNRGNKTEVLLSVKEFEELLEDFEDLALAAKRRDEETISHEEVIEELNKDGLL